MNYIGSLCVYMGNAGSSYSMSVAAEPSPSLKYPAFPTKLVYHPEK
jgi:hypothetical protein